MKNVEIIWAGDMTLREKCREYAYEIIEFSTSEHKGLVTAWVVLGECQLTSSMITFIHKDELYMACPKENFVVILSYNVLDIRELILMYDSIKIGSEELDLPVDLNELL